MPDLTENEFLGRVALITGASSGIGEALSLEMARRKARVILLVRSRQLGEAACKRIRDAFPAADLQLEVADLSLASSVVDFCRTFNERVDILVNNAGVYGPPFSRTKEGAECVMAANHLGHFLLTCLLLAGDKISSTARLILVTGAYYKEGSLEVSNWDNWSPEKYNRKQAYSNSKLAVCLFSLWLRGALRRVLGSSAKVFAVHPGLVNTRISRHVTAGFAAPFRACLRCCMALAMQSPQRGCQGLLMLAADHDIARRSGTYVNNRCEEPWIKQVLDEELVLRCWDFSFQWVKRSVSDAAVLGQLTALREMPRDSLTDLAG